MKKILLVMSILAMAFVSCSKDEVENPAPKYDLVVNTIPLREKKDITIYRNIHNTIEVDAPQGFLNIKMSNANRNYAIYSRIMEFGKSSTLNVQTLGSTDKYIVANTTSKYLHYLAPILQLILPKVLQHA